MYLDQTYLRRLQEDTAIEQKSESWEDTSHANTWSKHSSQRRKICVTSLVVGMTLIYQKDKKESLYSWKRVSLGIL